MNKIKYYDTIFRNRSYEELKPLFGTLNFELVDTAGETPLITAVNLDMYKTVIEMLSLGADVRTTTTIASPLGAAISSTKPYAPMIFAALVSKYGRFKHPEDPMHYCSELNEPMLHAAIRRRKSEIILLLIENGYDPIWTDSDGVSAIELAEELGVNLKR